MHEKSPLFSKYFVEPKGGVKLFRKNPGASCGCTLNSQQGKQEGGRQALCQDSHQTGKNKQAMQEMELWSGRKICFPAPEEQAHLKLDGFSRKQPDLGHRTTLEEAVAPPPENNMTWFFVFSPT